MQGGYWSPPVRCLGMSMETRNSAQSMATLVSFTEFEQGIPLRDVLSSHGRGRGLLTICRRNLIRATGVAWISRILRFCWQGHAVSMYADILVVDVTFSWLLERWVNRYEDKV
jgi:hypothetical protein